MNGQDLALFFGKLVTPELVTVVGALVTAWIGWKAAAKSFGLVSGLLQKTSFLGIVSIVLFIGGLGTTGVGIGEIASISNSSEKAVKKGIPDSTLYHMIQNCSNEKSIKLAIEYAKVRDGDMTESDRAVVEIIKEMKEKGKDVDNKVMIAFIEYLKTKDAQYLNQTTPISYSQENFEFHPQANLTNKNQIGLNLGMPASAGMIGFGIGMLVCGGILFLRMT